MSRINVSLKPGVLEGGGAPFLGSAGLDPAAFPPDTLAFIALMSLRVLGERLVRSRS